MGIGSADNLVALNLGVGNLTNDVLVGESDNHTVLGSVVLILVLNDKSSSGIVISSALCRKETI